MQELPCEKIAHQAGFNVSVGNWIAPNGTLITGQNDKSNHWETIKAYLEYEPETDNHLAWMNNQVNKGYIRIMFRINTLFQAGCLNKKELWTDKPNFHQMRVILKRIPDVQVYIFSRQFYIIGCAKDFLDRNFDVMRIKEWTTNTKNK